MKWPTANSIVEQMGNYFTESFRHPRSSQIFFNALVAYLLIKLLFIWDMSAAIAQSHIPSLPRSLAGKVMLLPVMLAEINFNLFYITAIVFLLIAFFCKPYSLVRFIFFYLSFNLYVINLPLANGSDTVHFMLSLWCIPMGRFPSIQIPVGLELQKVVFNLGRVLCQIQIVNTYLISGLDKLFTRTWQSGEAFAFITHLDYYYNPILPSMFESATWNFILSWTTILFELLFVVLVWIPRTRLIILAMAVVFNLYIWIVLSLPDFAILMIVSLLIFLKDEDYETVTKKFRRSPL